jgi:SAM-dependent methyltransferase
MNKAHLEFLASPVWAEMLKAELLPWLAQVADLGDYVLEVGPGPGLTTDILRGRTSKVIAVEADPELAAALATRLSGTNVTVLHADATKSGLESGRFSAVTCFSVLHHMPSAEIQDRLFGEACRMLRPGGVLVATDSLDSEAIRKFHTDDVFVPLDPATLESRLHVAGFASVRIAPTTYELRFTATKHASARSRAA